MFKYNNERKSLQLFTIKIQLRLMGEGRILSKNIVDDNYVTMSVCKVAVLKNFHIIHIFMHYNCICIFKAANRLLSLKFN